MYGRGEDPTYFFCSFFSHNQGTIQRFGTASPFKVSASPERSDYMGIFFKNGHVITERAYMKINTLN